MIVIAFDVMGNDFGVKSAILASNVFLSKNPSYKIIFVGDEDEIIKFLDSKISKKQYEIVNVKQVIDVKKGVFSRDEITSMSTAIELVKNQKALAVISSGPSASYLSLATLLLKRLNGVNRPAFMPVFPTIEKNKKFVMLDAGANLEVNSEILIQWAKIGSVFAKQVLKIDKPKVALLNIGTEDNKGFVHFQEANAFLKKETKINYVGFVESRDLLNNIVDVAVIDGYGGNLILKTMEGTGLTIFKTFKKLFLSKMIYKIAYLILKKGLNDIFENFDYRNIGAAWIIGLNGLAIKSHGSSDVKAFIGALNQIKDAIDSNALKKFSEVLVEND